mmetsp:Transcript_12090/g.32540  ORF Transcript_12090/g.32540 Transcript_12090/m.32540 type:complete len:150 (+) Transcript_12090:112-561(+)
MSAFITSGASSLFARSVQSNAQVCRKSGMMRMSQEDKKAAYSPVVTKQEVKKDVIKAGPNVNKSGEGFFGFTAFSEVWNGRFAMIGLVAAVVNELRTGEGVLRQVGLPPTEGYVLACVMLGFSIFASLGYISLKKAEQIDEVAGKNKKY